MPGASLGGGGQNFFIINIRDKTFKLKYKNLHINLRNSFFFFPGASMGGEGAKFLFSLLFEIELSNTKTSISPYYLKKFNKIIFARGVPGGEWAIFIFSLFLEIGPLSINNNIFIFKIFF